MVAIEKLKQILTEHGVPFTEGPSSITVKASAPSGFDVSMHEGEETTVYFEAWHEHFTDPEEAVRCFMAGLSPNCRIRVTERGEKPHSWVLERSRGDQWVSHSATALVFFRFWRTPKVKSYRMGSRVALPTVWRL